ncbi:MAG: thiamine-monophosphate kinase [Bacteroidetes bacterium OLB12]|nr:MAG: thiamine-monophosphate kinase [Bacteroidetes bacterium OLB12]
MGENRTELSQLGEFGLIDRINSKFQSKNASTLKGIGDDAAMIDAGDNTLLVSTDILLEGVHFDLAYMPLQHLGYKAVAVNVSDIAAMNGIAEQIVLGLAISNRFSLEAVDAFFEGVQAACKNYNVDLVGGDTASSAAGLVISITVLGRADKKRVVQRSGAHVNDIICVTGDLGAAYLGLQVLAREKQVFLSNPDMQPDLEKYEYLVGRQLKPEARMDIIHELRDKNCLPTSMIDISDGLASELFHLGKILTSGLKFLKIKYQSTTIRLKQLLNLS